MEDAFSGVASFVPKLVGFLVILFIGYFVAKIIGKAIDAVLERVGFDRAVERGGIKKALASSKYDASDVVSKIVFYTLFLFVLQLAFGVFGANPVSDLLASVIAFLPKVVVAVIIVVVAAAIATAVKDIVANALGGLSYGKSLATAASVSILVLGGFMALNQLQIAEDIVNSLFVAILAAAVGCTIVAVGGGGIKPMQARWERAMTKLDQESSRVRRELDLNAEEQRGTPTPASAASVASPAPVRRSRS